ncbi:family S53 protease-like protein [Dichomitus squalens]|uniref:Family S53 protease-like protein n=1 Tax=Dichomitus squalens TaxID=114155 RepID=A0A4V2K008_9APHY|nr:family S53 protease-like protein [Dichomitus squalens]
MPMVIALNPNNKTGLVDTLMDISDPASPNYRKFLSKEEAASFMTPAPESVQAVTSWLAKYNVTPDVVSPAGDIMRIHVPIATANALLSANYSAFVQEGTGATAHKTDVYAIPEAVQPHLAFVYPTTQVAPAPRSRKTPVKPVAPPKRGKRTLSKRAVLPATCVDGISPTCVQALYNMPTAPATNPNNHIAVSGFLNEIPNQQDLNEFLFALRKDITGTIQPFSVESIDGGVTDTQGPGTLEASLDIQYTVGLATNVPTTFVSVGPNNQDGVGGFLDIINFLLAQDSPPPVLTTSFSILEGGIGPDVLENLCLAYAQLGTRGTSILFASGDGGVAGQEPLDTCPDDLFLPTFPSTCPYVTSVGSTEGVAPEVAGTFSAGGFSNIFPVPDYQSSAAQNYLNALNISSDNPLSGKFNTTGRAFPDVSTTGRDITIIVNGTGQPVLGTSASTPIFASMVALVNEQLLNAGQPPLGFLNPLLYASGTAAVFNDIVVGNNPGCGTPGFPALPGWDPVTGLGTPDFLRLLSLVMPNSSTSTTNIGI